MLYPDFEDLVAYKNQKSTLKLHPNRSIKSMAPGNNQSPFRGRGLEFDAVREYVPGDDIRSIDWRVTARTGAPHIKLFREERERHLILCVDMNATMQFGTRKTFKSVQAARAAAFLGWHGIAQHDSVSACLFGRVPEGLQYFSPKRKRKSFCEVLRMLTEPLTDRHEVQIDTALQHIYKASHNGALVYLISDFMNLDNIRHTTTLSALCKKCNVVFISINDQADRMIYPVGALGLCSHGEKSYVNTDSIAGRESYAEKWKENRRLLCDITKRFKIPLIETTTESIICQELNTQLKSIMKRKTK